MTAFTTFFGQDLFDTSRLSIRQTIDLPVADPITLDVQDNDDFLSGDSARFDTRPLDRSQQTATRLTPEGDAISLGKISIEQVHIVEDENETQYTLVQIDRAWRGGPDSNDYYSFVGLVPQPGTSLTVVAQRNAGLQEVRYADLGVVASPMQTESVDDAASTDEDTGITGNLLENDENAQDLFVVSVDGTDAGTPLLVATATGQSGTLNVDASGAYSFDPSGGFDSLADGERADVTVTVTLGREVTGTERVTRTIDFETFGAGTILSDQVDGLTIDGDRKGWGWWKNAAMVFDADNPTGEDDDLGVAGQGKILILSEDFDSADPDDNGRGGTFDLTLDSPATVESLTFIDIERGARIKAYDADHRLIDVINVGRTEDSGVRVVDIGLDGVASLEIKLRGSGAIDDLVITEDVAVTRVETFTSELTIEVAGKNDVAAITGDTARTVTEDGTLSAIGTLTVTDLDAGEDRVEAQTVTRTTGTFEIDETGAWSFALANDAPAVQALNAGERLTEVFTVRSGDGTAVQDVTITIEGSDDAPIANDDWFTVLEDATSVPLDLLGNDTGGPAATLRVATINGEVVDEGLDDVILLANGVIRTFADGDVLYTPNADFAGLENFSYTIADGGLESDPATAEVTVTPVADAPEVTLALLDAGGGAPQVTDIRFLNDEELALRNSTLVNALPDGGFLVTFDEPLTSNQVFQRFDANGQPVGPRMDAIPNTNTGFEHDVVVLEDGGWLISSFDPNNSRVLPFQRYDSSGQPVGGVQQTISPIGFNPGFQGDLVALADGGWVIVVPGDGLLQTRFDLNGQVVGTPTVTPPLQNSYFLAESAALPDGGWIVASTQNDAGGQLSLLTLERFDSTGARVGTGTAVNAPNGDLAIVGDVAVLEDGGWIVTWFSFDVAGNVIDEVLFQRFDDSGTPVGPQTVLLTIDDSVQVSLPIPRATALDDGGWLIAATVTTPTGEDILAQRFDADGNEVGALTQLVPSLTSFKKLGGDGFTPDALAVLDDGRLVVGFTSEEDALTSRGDVGFTILDLDEGIGEVAQPISIALDVALTDTDGSEVLSSVVLEGLPVGAVLTDGTAVHTVQIVAADQVVDITGWDASGLTATPPADFTGTITVSVTATTTEALNGATASSTATAEFDVAALNDAPALIPDAVLPGAAAGSRNTDPAFSFDLATLIEDPEGDSFTLTATVLPQGFALVDGVLIQTDPTNPISGGDYTLEVTATDLRGAVSVLDIPFSVAFDHSFPEFGDTPLTFTDSSLSDVVIWGGVGNNLQDFEASFGAGDDFVELFGANGARDGSARFTFSEGDNTMFVGAGAGQTNGQFTLEFGAGRDTVFFGEGAGNSWGLAQVSTGTGNDSISFEAEAASFGGAVEADAGFGADSFEFLGNVGRNGGSIFIDLGAGDGDIDTVAFRGTVEGVTISNWEPGIDAAVGVTNAADWTLLATATDTTVTASGGQSIIFDDLTGVGLSDLLVTL